MRNKIIFSLLFIVSLHLNIYGEIERRCGIDFGSGSLKMLVADVDLESHHIVEYVYSSSIKIPTSDHLAKNKDGLLDERIEEIALNALNQLVKEAKDNHATRFFGVATESFRIAKNGQQVAQRLFEKSGVFIKILSQKEESALGFHNAIEHSKGVSETAVVWDIGGGSFQVSWKEGDEINSFMGQFGKVPTKNLVLAVQNKSKDKSPNPISYTQALAARKCLQSKLKEIPEELKMKIKDPSTRYYGIGGVHHGNIALSTKSSTYTLESVDQLINERLNKKDSDFVGVASPEYWVTDLLLVSSIMSYLEIPYILDVKSFDEPHLEVYGNTAGIVTKPEFWQK